MAVLKGIAAGMADVHSKRICHGDLNPANVLLKVCRRCYCECELRLSKIYRMFWWHVHTLPVFLNLRGPRGVNFRVSEPFASQLVEINGVKTQKMTEVFAPAV
jgi:hypothetical protein